MLILAEAILNKVGAGKFQPFSAGSQPKGRVHSEATKLLQSLGLTRANFVQSRGTSSPNPARLRSISSLPSATTPPEKSVRSSPANR
jgi:hypothetical protein